METTNGILECKARGVFRNRQQTPCAGDWVETETLGEGKGLIVSMKERKNSLTRPMVANLDKLLLVISSDRPRPNLYNIDCMTAILDYKEIEPVLVITKTDLSQSDWLCTIYRNAGFRVYSVNNLTGEGTLSVKEELKDCVSVLCGNTGVGKTSLLNRIFPGLQQKTALISDKLGRGRHTTRQVELFPLPEGGYVADTPGFSTIDLWNYETIMKDKLELAFRDFEDYRTLCKFTGCSHTAEKGCAVLAAVAAGKIEKTRHESYCALYSEAKDVKEWEQK